MRYDFGNYQHMFSRYLRTGISIETQFQAAEQKALGDRQREARLVAKAMTILRIDALKRKFALHGRPFPDTPPPDIVLDDITNEVIQMSRSLKPGGFLPNNF